MAKKNKEFIITCPHCGAEYLIEEIVMSEDLLGKRYAIKDELGHIINIDGEIPELVEEYICDFCNKKFETKVSMSAITKQINDAWEDDYVVDIYKDRVMLDE